MYTDITGAFPVRSFKSMQYIFVVYVYDLNAIIVHAMPSRTDASMVTAFREVITALKTGGYRLELNVMENECSAAVEKYIRSEQINIQLVPSHNHRVNAAERAITTFKEHFIAALATVDMHCHLQLWDEFLLQVELTLNMLRFSRLNPNKSANQEVYGSFDFNNTPLVPLGTRALIYDNPASQASWAPHATNGYYMGPASNHYRCLRFYIPATRRFCFSDTWRLYPAHSQVPVTSQHDLSISMAAELIKALGAVAPTTTTEKIKHIKAIQDLTAILAGRQTPECPTVRTGTHPTVSTGTPAPRVAAPSPRVVNTLPPRVATTSNNITAPNVIRNMPLVHGRHTRHNNPFNILTDDDDDDDTVVASNCSPRQPPPSLPTSDLPVRQPRNRPKRQITSQPGSHSSPCHLSSPPTSPPPRVLASPSHIQATAPTAPHIQIHDLRPTPAGKPNKPPAHTKQQSYSLPIVEQDDDRDEMPTTRSSTRPQRSTRLITNQSPCNISCQALYHVIGLGFTNAPAYTVPNSLAQHHKQYTDPLVNIEGYCYGVVHPVTKETITHYRKLIKDPLLKDLWIKAMSKELHCSAQGCPGVTKGTNTFFYLSHADISIIPRDRTETYARIVIDHQPQKEDPNRVRIAVGGNLIDYPFELTTHTANMVSSNILWNSVISTKDAHFAGADIKNMYRETPLDRYQYMKMPLTLFPADIIEYYKLMDKALDGYVYMEIQKGMYGLPQAGVQANKLLKERLAQHGYFEQPHTPCLWKHVSCPVWFNVCMDDFGIKHIEREYLQHLYDALRKETYEIVEDLDGDLYCGIAQKWNYAKHHVDLTMVKYVMKQLTKYGHVAPLKPQHCPYSQNPIKYGKDNQSPSPLDDSPLLDEAGKKRVQQIFGSFLYYARAVDPTILIALSEISSQQSAPTENTMKRVNQFLDCMWTHPDAIIWYRASDMILNVHSDVSYLSASKARSHAGGYFFYGSLPHDRDPILLLHPQQKPNWKHSS